MNYSIYLAVVAVICLTILAALGVVQGVAVVTFLGGLFMARPNADRSEP